MRTGLLQAAADRPRRRLLPHFHGRLPRGHGVGEVDAEGRECLGVAQIHDPFGVDVEGQQLARRGGRVRVSNHGRVHSFR